MALPDNYKIEDSGFSASWICSSISSGIPATWQGGNPPDERRLADSFIETVLIDVHSHYAQNERAVKYAVLFILVPFITLFMFEQLFKKPVHIVQYILTGTANIIFYLLLLSLSEHIHFNYSYLISSAAVTVMVCLYTFSMLKGEAKAWYMAPVMISAYLFLFVTLQSEDWALLIGSIGVFVITGFLMFVTRKIDFYRTQ
jgi:inner membrane protein